MKYLYYPGCSVKGTAVEFEQSFLAMAPHLGMEVREMEGWGCCGATVAKSMDPDLARNLPRRTFQQAPPEGGDLLMLCPSCHLNHQTLVRRAEEEARAGGAMELPRFPRVKQLLEVLAFDLGPEEIKKKVRRPLRGLRVLPYYGCLVVRPFGLGGKESLENPLAMERLIEAAGGEAISIPERIDCCGGGILMTQEKTALKLGAALFRRARVHSPDCLAVVCPLCHFMLDAKQRAMERETGERIRLPVLYLTQILGLALGLDPAGLGWSRLITPPFGLLSRSGEGGQGETRKKS